MLNGKQIAVVRPAYNAARTLRRTYAEIAQDVVDHVLLVDDASRENEGDIIFAASKATLAIHLAIHRIEAIAAELTPFYGADCPAAVVARATWPDERILRGTLGDIAQQLAAAPIERSALVLVGRALAAEDFRDSALYDPDYRRRFRGGGE